MMFSFIQVLSHAVVQELATVATGVKQEVSTVETAVKQDFSTVTTGIKQDLANGVSDVEENLSNWHLNEIFTVGANDSDRLKRAKSLANDIGKIQHNVGVDLDQIRSDPETSDTLAIILRLAQGPTPEGSTKYGLADQAVGALQKWTGNDSLAVIIGGGSIAAFGTVAGVGGYGSRFCGFNSGVGYRAVPSDDVSLNDMGSTAAMDDVGVTETTSFIESSSAEAAVDVASTAGVADAGLTGAGVVDAGLAGAGAAASAGALATAAMVIGPILIGVGLVVLGLGLNSEFQEEAKLKRYIRILCVARLALSRTEPQLVIINGLVPKVKAIVDLDRDFITQGGGVISQANADDLNDAYAKVESEIQKTLGVTAWRDVWEKLNAQDIAESAWTTDDPSLQEMITDIKTMATGTAGMGSD